MRKFWNDGDMLAVLREEADKNGTGAGDGGGAGAGTGGGTGDQPTVDAKALQAEIERLKAESAEKDNAVRYWHEQAKSAGKGTQQKQQQQDEPEADLIEVASSKGVKGVAELLKKQGFVSAEEVETRIEQRAQQIATENALAAKYPDLSDSTSEFFKETAKHYATLTNSGVPKALAMKLAADQAALDGIETGKRKSKVQIEAERKQAEKEERDARAKAQAADRSRGRSQEAEEDDGELDAFQKAICAAMEIDEEAYKKRAKSGVVVGGHK